MWVVEHLGVGVAPLCLETSMDLTDELRMLAEDLHVNGYNRYSAAMSKAADELGSLQRYRTAYNEWIDKTEWVQESRPSKYIGMHRADALKDMIFGLEERTRRLEAAEKERDALRTELADLRSSMTFRTSLIGRIEAERDALQAKVEAMEKQEPVAWCATDETGTVIEALGMNQSRRFDTALYRASGAKGEEK